jgi:hypothetical protein
MRSTGTIVAVALVAAVASLLYTQLPDIQRYLKMRSM